jgi:RNA polymerase sigma-70 factor (ECF subfamily)
MTMTRFETTSDAALVSLIASGDQEAFAAVYDRHVSVVYGATLRFLRDEAIAEEVVQDAFVGLWQRAELYDPDAGSLIGWLLRIARNKAIDRARASAARPRPVSAGAEDRDSDRLLDLALAADADADGPDRAAVRGWTRSVVRTAWSALPEVERRALELAYDEGLTQNEIAERTGWPIGTVKTRTRRALANLRMSLESVPELVDIAGPSAVGGHDGSR